MSPVLKYLENYYIMDLTRIELIQDSNLEELRDHRYLETMIMKLGFNNESLMEQPEIVRENCGGLLIWQYPNQFSKYLCLLSQQKIESYLEIGCRWGGTFVLTNEYLKKFNHVHKSVAVDIIDSPVAEYCQLKNEAEFLKLDSGGQEFKNYIANHFFDLILIDGDHSYYGVKNDYEISKHSGKILVFHDIKSDACLGVVKFWTELKNTKKDEYDFFEFTEQYADVWNRTHRSFLGIGVAIKKDLPAISEGVEMRSIRRDAGVNDCIFEKKNHCMLDLIMLSACIFGSIYFLGVFLNGVFLLMVMTVPE